MRILLAEDHVIVRQGTRQLLEQEQDFEVVGEAGDGEEAVHLASQLKPDVVIMDVAMPKLSGIEATKQIKALLPSAIVLVLTGYDYDEYVFSLMEAGAAGYLLKSVRSHELIDAIRAVYAGESVLHPAIARKVLNRFALATSSQPPRQKPAEVLSEREIEVLRLATQGLSNQDIASELCLSLRTVQAHLGHIFNKLQVTSRTEAVVHALKEGWITLEDIP